MAIDDRGEVQFTSRTQFLLHQCGGHAQQVADAVAQLQGAVFLEEIEQALAALIRAGKALVDHAVITQDAVQVEAEP